MGLRLLGRRIREARERLGITQEELAARLGKTQNAISGYENGNRAIRVTELPQLAEALGVPIAYFFGDLDSDEEISILLAQFPALLAQLSPERRREVIARLRLELELLWQAKSEKTE